jgi:hypothetical protein
MILAGMLLISAVAGLWGALSVSLPSAGPEDAAPVELWVYLPIPIAALVVGGLHSDMRAFEDTATGVLARAQIQQVVAALVVGTVFLGGALVVAGSPATAAGAVRDLLFWSGLALISGRIWRWSLCWLLPLIALFPFDWFGLEVAGPKSWAWPMLPSTDVASWAATAVALLAGVATHMATPWRLRRLRRVIWRTAQSVAAKD